MNAWFDLNLAHYNLPHFHFGLYMYIILHCQYIALFGMLKSVKSYTLKQIVLFSHKYNFKECTCVDLMESMNSHALKRYQFEENQDYLWSDFSLKL